MKMRLGEFPWKFYKLYIGASECNLFFDYDPNANDASKRGNSFFIRSDLSRHKAAVAAATLALSIATHGELFNPLEKFAVSGAERTIEYGGMTFRLKLRREHDSESGPYGVDIERREIWVADGEKRDVVVRAIQAAMSFKNHVDGLAKTRKAKTK